MSTRNIPPYLDAAAILIGQLREIYFEPELKPVDTTNWYPKLLKKDYMVGLNVSETVCVRLGSELHRLLQAP